MHVPVKVDYGVRALVDLAIHGADGPVRASDIAGRTNIPAPYLAQVLHSLSQKSLVKSQRGPQGGHSLDADPHTVSLSAVLEALGGMDTPVACLGDAAICAHVPSCAQREVWQEVDRAVYRILDETTVGHLVDRTRAIQAQRHESVNQNLKIVAV